MSPVVPFIPAGIHEAIGLPIKKERVVSGPELAVRLVAIHVDVFGDQICGYGHPTAGINPIEVSLIPGTAPPTYGAISVI